MGNGIDESLGAVARDFANGCRTLDTITFGITLRYMLARDGLSLRVMREKPGEEVKELRKVWAMGNVIGREEEW